MIWHLANYAVPQALVEGMCLKAAGIQIHTEAISSSGFFLGGGEQSGAMATAAPRLLDPEPFDEEPSGLVCPNRPPRTAPLGPRSTRLRSRHCDETP